MTVNFPLIGEHLALDLLNTRPADGDLIAEPDGLAGWLAEEAERLGPVAGGVGEAEVVAVVAVREAARAALAAVRGGERPPVDALRVLNAALAGAPAHRELDWTAGSGLTADRVRPTVDPAARLAAELAEAVTELLTGPRVGEVRECEGAECVLLFLPAHPRRRWCVAGACGNRARVARYYARRRA
ncbi:ABATE domain-containing protein [Streptomyces sp. NBC_00513]|uniref:ABATE domain-containing protein n=1 Tax=unclassified Streptomyces TaxID=2593676 RepID=UPI00225890F9|nr:ABATE domain-containing protein [Streptomyces sp. NBC_00424]MCX5075015.1 ABATE domain-containing protein [Streptomyces sp. NBC_00424]WUD41834.1 ABATE domain-containing protein [Streptomyces sp. NBC_00513]